MGGGGGAFSVKIFYAMLGYLITMSRWRENYRVLLSCRVPYPSLELLAFPAVKWCAVTLH